MNKTILRMKSPVTLKYYIRLQDEKIRQMRKEIEKLKRVG
jgi:hypothetical protein